MRTEPDPELVAYASARQHWLVEIAYLVCGDRRLADDAAVTALVALTRRWRRERADPDPHLRAAVYHDAMAIARRRLRESPAAPEVVAPAGPAGVEAPGLAGHAGPGIDRSSSIAEAFDLLSPRRRALLVLLLHEDRSPADAARVLGVSDSTLRRERSAALAALPPVVGEADVADLLDERAAQVQDVDVVDRVWATREEVGSSRRRRGIALGTAAAVLLVGAAGVAWTARGERQAEPGPTPPVTVSRPWTQGADFRVDGGTLLVGPGPTNVGDLPQLALSMPDSLGVAWNVPTLGDVVRAAGADASRLHVVAAMLRTVGDGSSEPLLLVRDSATLFEQYAVVDVVLTGLGSDLGSPVSPIGARSIDPTGTHVLFVQPGDLVVLDAATGRTRRLAVPVGPGDPPLVGGGFTDSGRIVAWSHSAAWSLGLDGHDVRAMPAGATADAVRLLLEDGEPSVTTAEPAGRIASTRRVRMPMSYPWGDSVATPAWVATGAFVDPKGIPKPAGSFVNGLFAASLVPEGTQRSLVMDDWDSGVVKGGLRVCGWTDDTILFQYSAASHTWVLAWDLNRNRLSRVSIVDPSMTGVGSASQVVALWFQHPLPG